MGLLWDDDECLVLIGHPRGSQPFSDHVPLQHFDRWACRLLFFNLHISGKNHKILENLVNRGVKKLDHWVRANKLCISYSKSNSALMNKHNNINFSVSINHHPISKQSSLKYLGVIFYDIFDWKPQIEELVTQLPKSCGMSFKLNTIPIFQCSNLFALLFSIPV